MNTAKVLVTGGAGFIGSHVVDALLAHGHKVVALDNFATGHKRNLSSALQSSSFRLIDGDLLDKETVLSAVGGVDYVFHLACLGVRHSLHSPLENHMVNADGTLRLLEACRAVGIRHFFYISTSEVFGKAKSFPLSESTLPRPVTVYGASKLAGEHYVGAYRESFGLSGTVLRMFNNYGPRSHYEKDAGEMVPRTILRLFDDKNPIIFGDGLVTRDFIFVKDAASVIASMIDKKDQLPPVMNLGSGVEITMKELVLNIQRAMSKDHISVSHVEARPADVPRLYADISLFMKVFGGFSFTTFQQGLNETIDYFADLSKAENLSLGFKEKNWEV